MYRRGHRIRGHDPRHPHRRAGDAAVVAVAAAAATQQEVRKGTGPFPVSGAQSFALLQTIAKELQNLPEWAQLPMYLPGSVKFNDSEGEPVLAAVGTSPPSELLWCPPLGLP